MKNEFASHPDALDALAMGLARARRRFLRPPLPLTVDEWADEYRTVPRETSPTPGKWQTSRYEVARGPMRWATEPGVHQISIMACVQLLKALDINTPIPTADGWKLMGDLQVGDRVFDERGKPCRVIKATEVLTGRKCYRLTFSDGTEVVCDAGHLWYVERGAGRKLADQKPMVIEAEEIAQTYRILRKTPRGIVQNNVYAVPVSGPLDLPDVDLPIPPYTMGAWLGDGHTSSANITLHESDGEILDRIRSEGFTTKTMVRTETGVVTSKLDFTSADIAKREGFCRRGHDMNRLGRGKGKVAYCSECKRQQANIKFGKTMDAPRLDFESLGMRLRRLGISADSGKGIQKRIPPIYMRASIEQRMELLRGLMDTDGTISEKTARPSFSTKHAMLANDVMLLLRSLGFKPTFNCIDTACTYKGERREGMAFLIHFMAYSDTPVFGLSRKLARMRSREDGRSSEASRRRIVNVEEVPSRPVRCIAVDSPSHLFLCGGGMIPTHNTSVLENVIGHTIHLRPRPMILAQADKDERIKFVKDKLEPMIRLSRPLQSRVGKTKGKDEDQTQSARRFPGGRLALVDASTAEQSFSMIPAAIVLLDEVDKWKSKLLTDPIELARRRTTRYAEAGMDLVLSVCSPSNKGESRIDALFEEGDQRRPFVLCPHSGEWQTLEWGGRDTLHGVKWDKDSDGNTLPDTARYVSRSGHAWTEEERRDALRGIQWRQTKKFTCCGEEQEPNAWDWVPENGVGYALCAHCGSRAIPNKHASGQASRLYDPQPLSRMVEGWLSAQGNPARLAEWFREERGEPFESVAERLDPDKMMERREVYEAPAPDGVSMVTFGIDVGQDRIEVEWTGWGAGEESWSLRFERVYGDTSQREVWDKLQEVLESARFERADGRRMIAMAGAIDSGHATQQVYRFVGRNRSKRWWAVKGSSWDQRPGKPAPVWPRKPQLDVSGKRSVPLYMVGGQEARRIVMGRLRLGEPGPGYCHWPSDGGHDDAYFRQLARGYRRVPKAFGGRTVFVWEDAPGERCEALDCRVYAYAALCGLQQDGHDADDWAARIGAAPRRVDDAPAPAPAPAPRDEPEPEAPAPYRPGPKPRRRIRFSVPISRGSAW